MAKRKIDYEIGLLNLIYGLLNELGIALPKDFMDSLAIKTDKITFELTTDVDAKLIVKALRNGLKWRYLKFELDVKINGKRYHTSYPNPWEMFTEWLYWEAAKHPLVYALFIALVPFYITIIYFLCIKQLPPDFNKHVQSVSDAFLNICILLSSLIVTFLVTKAIAIRQEKSGRIGKVRALSRQISAFREVCDSLIGDWSLWPDSKFLSYGLSLKKTICYAEIADMDWDNDELVERFSKWVLKSDYGEIIPKLYLQLVAWSNDSNRYLRDDDHIYSLRELERWTWFIENNLIWYVFDNEKQDYEKAFHFTNSYYGGEVKAAAKKFDPDKYAKSAYYPQLLLDISSDVQHNVLPELYKIVSKNEEGLPFVFSYFLVCFSVIILAGVVLKSLSDIMFAQPAADLISLQLVMAVLIHIFICLPLILKEEISLHPKHDYL
ncbi:MAG: hypothetical protein JWQ34_2639 [Mucilaginibacter sp.]|uniref:hypothetical protein n=1 Tax=Mucilaginibacter sp. TaxID=1882438 RepID=UPI00262A8DFB|nr:hypothetical protein [Mucilaginibacter sp.]MDB5004414.1 hypothetical protein [Mucilaginibacter sp.]